ncbi:MAG: hypothetical protein KIS76_13820 [Pyrinomonadaceae bacterium]|nr:hypothetical protein [Pyrinomonadaceae bacterium]
MKEEILYNQSSILIAILLFVVIVLANEIGFRIGVAIQNRSDEEIRSQTNAIQAGMLGLLALLLGFTFSMSLNRYDNRSQAVISEANAIGTAILRTELLPEPFRSEEKALLQKYVDLRIEVGGIDLTETEARAEFNKKAGALQNEIWAKAVAATEVDPRPVTTGLFISSLNEMIDSQGKRNALQQMHVPEVVLFLLFVVFAVSGAILGYASGLGGKRPVVATVLMTLLIVLIVFIIIDLDRPKRGLIQVSQQSILELKQ